MLENLNTLDILYTLLFAALPVLLIILVLVKRKFFVIDMPEYSGVSWLHVFIGLICYLVPPVAVATIGSFAYHFLSYDGINFKMWIGVLGTILGGITLIVFAIVLQCNQSFLLWNKIPVSRFEALKNFLWGARVWCVSFPLVFFVTLLVYLFFSLFGVEHLPEQVAISFMKNSISNPLLLSFEVLLVVIIAPFSEEILFRGLFQNLMLKYWGRGKAVIGSSILFALFHYASSQGLSNIALLSSLFVLSLFLGTLYEKYQSLWAPIGLHVTFNAISITLTFLVC